MAANNGGRSWFRRSLIERLDRLQHSLPRRKRIKHRPARDALVVESLETRMVPASIQWINAGAGQWDVPANWSTGSLPGPADDVVINTPAAATITIQSNDRIAIHSITTAANDQLAMTGGQFLFTGNSTLGSGLSLSGGAFNAAANLAIAGTLAQTGGVLTGSGSVVVAGPVQWVGGSMTGSGSTQANGGLQLGADDGNGHAQTLSARSLVNNGSGSFFAGDVFNQDSGATFTNSAGAALELQAGMTWSGDDKSAQFINAGAMTVNAEGDVAKFEGYLVNNGSIAINAGKLWLHDGGVSTGSMTVAAGATLLFPSFGDTFTFSGSASLMGAGTVELDGDAWVVFAPGTTYNVSGLTQLSGELVLNNGTAAMGTLDLPDSGGELTGSATVTVSGLTTWEGGMMSGSGSTIAKGGLQLGTPDNASPNSVLLTGRSLINQGTTTWYDALEFDQHDSSIFTNAVGANINIVGAPLWGVDGSGSFPSFVNLGTLTFAGVTDTTLAKVYFDNAGSVQINSGTLGFGNSGILKGTISVAAGATFELGNNFNYEAYTFTSTSILSGAGAVDFGAGVQATFQAGSTYNISGSTLVDTSGNDNAGAFFNAGSLVPALGDLTIHSGLVNFATAGTITVPSFTQIAGALSGPDAVVVTGATNWSGGQQLGSGSTTAAGGLTLGANDGQVDQEEVAVRTLINAGIGSWIGSGKLVLIAGGTFVNQVGATFTELGALPISADVSVGQEPSGYFRNHGTLTITSGATASMEPFFFNDGTVEIVSGTWELSGGGSATGTFQVDAGATFQLNKHYGMGGQITGAGTTTTIDGSQANPVAFAGGDIPVQPNGPSFFIVATDMTVGSLNMTGGFLIVDGTLTVTGAMNWSGGYIVGPGKIIAEGGLTIGVAQGDQQFWYGTTLVNQGAATIFGAAEVGMDLGASFINQAGATITIQGGSQGFTSDGTTTIDNEGTITANIGIGTTYGLHFVNLTNPGNISITTGTLNLDSAGAITGTVNVGAGDFLDLAHGSWDFAAGSTLAGAGEVDANFNYWPIRFEAGSTYNITGTTDLDSQSSVVFFPGSSVAATGLLTVESGGVLFNTGSTVFIASLAFKGGVFAGSDTANIVGSTNWTGGEMQGTGVTNAEGGLTVGMATNDQGRHLSERTFINSGSGTFIGTQPFIESYSATFINAQGATLQLATHITWGSQDDNTSTLVNIGAIRVSAGAGVFSISSSPGRPAFLQNAGSIEVAVGTLEMRVDGTSTGTLTVDAGASLKLDDNAFFQFGAGSGVSGAGTVLLDGSVVIFDAGAGYTGSGSTTIAGGVDFKGNIALAALTLISGGELTGPGTVTVNGLTTWTGGSMSGSGMTLPAGGLLLGLAADSGDSEILAGRTLINSGNATWAGGGNFNQAAGSVFLNAATGSLTIANDINWNSDNSNLFLNAGSFTKTGVSAKTTFQAPLNNTGAVQVQKGTLSLTTNGVEGGTYTIVAPGKLVFDNDTITTGSTTFPQAFTSGNWAASFSGTTTDGSGTGIASVGVSLFDGTHYFDGTGFTSTTPVFNAAVLNGANWTYTIPVSIFTSDKTYTVQAQAKDNGGGTEPATTVKLVLSQAPPQISSISPAAGPVTGGTLVTINGAYLSGATAVDFGSNHPATIVSSSPTGIVVMSPVEVAGVVDITVTTDQGVSAVVAVDQFTYVALPTSSVASLPATTTSSSFLVSWTGQGATGSSGIAYYDIYSSDNGGAFLPWKSHTTATSATFTGQNGHTYGFYSVATDNVGGVQPTPAGAQATTTLNVPVPPVSSVTELPAFSKPSFTVSWSGTDTGGPGIATYDIFVSDNGGAFTAFLTGTAATSATFNGLAGHTYGFYSIATDSNGNHETPPAVAQTSTQALLDTPNKAYTDAVYSDLLGRSPDLGGLNFWSGQLDQGAARATLINLIDHSAEYFGTIIKPAYEQFLGRNADPAGIAFWTNAMTNGLTDEQLEAGFVGSAEFYTHSGGTDTSWVDAMYESLLGRHADSGGQSFWTQQLANGATRQSVAFGFAASLEREGQHVEDHYIVFLGRPAGSSEIAFWVGQFSHGVTNEDIITGFVASNEYFGKNS